MRAAAAIIACALIGSCGSRSETPPPPSNKPNPAPAGGVLPSDSSQRRFDAERRPDRIIQALELGEGARVADIGANNGMFTVHLALAVGPTGKVVATDIDEAVLDLLAQRMAMANVTNVERRIVPPEEPSLEAGAYDAIVLAEVDHFLADAAAWFAKAKSALKRGGRIAVTNRIHKRQRALDAASAAGLVLKLETSPTETHFLAVFTAP
jgi:cyclopropane fatty-acyl-phospholipid synthase-like methyltransferase